MRSCLCFLFFLSLISCILLSFIAQFSFTSSHWIWPLIYYKLHEFVITRGSLTIIDKTLILYPNEYIITFGSAIDNKNVTIVINDGNHFQRVLLEWEIGVGESYSYGEWTTDDLTSYTELIAVNYYYNLQKHQSSAYYLSLILEYSSIFQWQEMLSSKIIRGLKKDKQFIEAHYDLGVSLFQLFLDPTMTYTNANFLDKYPFGIPEIDSGEKQMQTTNDRNISLSECNVDQDELMNGQLNKIRRLWKKANIEDAENAVVIDIGSGFGFLSSWIVNNTNVSQMYGITLSKDQYAFSSQMYTHDRLQFIHNDYRSFVNGSEMFDAVFSVEMIEAIGYQEYDEFFRRISKALKPNARLILQYIACPLWFYSGSASYSNVNVPSVMPTFVGRHIFPGSWLPSEGYVNKIAWENNLQLLHTETFGFHYSWTLNLWANNLQRNKDKIIDLYGMETYLAFEYYLRWCQGLYRVGMLESVQVIFQKR